MGTKKVSELIRRQKVCVERGEERRGCREVDVINRARAGEESNVQCVLQNWKQPKATFKINYSALAITDKNDKHLAMGLPGLPATRLDSKSVN